MNHLLLNCHNEWNVLLYSIPIIGYLLLHFKLFMFAKNEMHYEITTVSKTDENSLKTEVCVQRYTFDFLGKNFLDQFIKNQTSNLPREHLSIDKGYYSKDDSLCFYCLIESEFEIKLCKFVLDHTFEDYVKVLSNERTL